MRFVARRVIIMRSEESYCRRAGEREWKFMFYSLESKDRFHYNFRLFHLLSSFRSVFLDLRSDWKLPIPALPMTSTMKVRIALPLIRQRQLKLNFNLRRCQKVPHILSMGVLRALLPRWVHPLSTSTTLPANLSIKNPLRTHRRHRCLYSIKLH